VKRILLVVSVALIMAAMLLASALPALAQGPPTVPPLPGQAIGNILGAAEINPAIAIDVSNQCVTLDTPGPEGTGHHSGYPDDSPCQP
jgi:hypothetical protein